MRPLQRLKGKFPPHVGVLVGPQVGRALYLAPFSGVQRLFAPILVPVHGELAQFDRALRQKANALSGPNTIRYGCYSRAWGMLTYSVSLHILQSSGH